MKWWVRESSNTTATYFCWAKWKWQKYSSRSHQQRTVVFIEDLTGKATLSDAINFYTENLESMVKQKTKEIQAMQANTITTALNSIKTSGVAWI